MNVESKNKDVIELHKQSEANKGLRLLGSARIQPGHRVFEFNTETKVLKQAENFIDTKIDWNDVKSTKRKKIKVNEKCIYVHALNKKNAAKKLLKEYKIEA